jgi:hypothetical protein
MLEVLFASENLSLWIAVILGSPREMSKEKMLPTHIFFGGL